MVYSTTGRNSSPTFDKITLAGSRAVLCVHMLVYVLDGSVGWSELTLWYQLLGRVEGLYQAELAKFEKYDAEELRVYIAKRKPELTNARPGRD